MKLAENLPNCFIAEYTPDTVEDTDTDSVLFMLGSSTESFPEALSARRLL